MSAFRTSVLQQPLAEGFPLVVCINLYIHGQRVEKIAMFILAQYTMMFMRFHIHK